MDEYIKVLFPVRRKVWVDGNPAGFTNKVFQIETGNHTITLGSSNKDYSPEQQEINVTGTVPTEPKIIQFILKEI